MEQFNELYGNMYHTNFSNHLAQHIFKTLDQDNDGYVSFKESISNISLSEHGTAHGKVSSNSSTNQRFMVDGQKIMVYHYVSREYRHSGPIVIKNLALKF